MNAVLTADPAEERTPEPAAPVDYAAYVRSEGGLNSLHLMVEGVHCGGCVRRIESALQADPDVAEARVNLTTRRLALSWRGRAARAPELARIVTDLGFRLTPYDPDRLGAADARQEKLLLRSLAVAGFAAANVMLLSVGVWAGHFSDMDPATRDLLHWFSALVALPAVVYAGQPFFRSALQALRHGRTNMDVPISLGVILAVAMSLFETISSGEHAYFDSAVSLLFFLLVGRYLDSRARGRARSAAERLLSIGATAATVLEPDGAQRMIPADALEPGMILLVAAGERVPADGRVLSGASELDTSLITGESVPAAVAAGDRVFAGTVNLGAPLRVEVTAVGETTLLAEIVRLMETAEQRRARYVALADRVARLYAPVVHLLALLTFIGWTLFGGLAWQPALLIAVAVLIITCPCALGLAVPAVQVIASSRLLRGGVLLKTATALERLAQVDTVVFDKTGTLTLGHPALRPDPAIDAATLRLAAGMAANSRHPLARALAAALPDVRALEGVRETPGCGLSLDTEAGELRLGSRAWCGIAADDSQPGMEMWLRRPDGTAQRFAFDDPLRADAAPVVAALKRRGYAVELLSGDRRPTVAAAAEALGIERWSAACTPAQKTERLAALAAEGRRVLMVGDGLNDAPALAAALVSLSPSTAVDISQTAADAVFQGAKLAPVLELLSVARRAERLVRQNFALAFGYNALAVPLAVAGLVTPLVAAICMSASSILVVGNAMRLARGGRPAAPPPAAQPSPRTQEALA